MTAALLNVERTWLCPNCTVGAVTRTAQPATPYHPCRALKGLSAPLVPEGSGARVFTIEREDYVGGEVVQLDGEGRPVMSVITERPDGSNDCAVFAPVASASAVALDK